MSVIMMMRMKADPTKLERYASTNAEKLQRISAEGKAKGCIHHHFAAGNGEVLVIDEWPDEAAFNDFFLNQTEIPEVIQGVGSQGKPQVTFYRKLDTPDEF